MSSPFVFCVLLFVLPIWGLDGLVLCYSRAPVAVHSDSYRVFVGEFQDTSCWSGGNARMLRETRTLFTARHSTFGAK